MITLTIIAKDEEVGIKRCIESALPFVDEIIVGIDSKSTDRTKEIAQEYTQKVYDFDWEDDFAKPRNMLIEKASNDWILVLDAHEYITGWELPDFDKKFDAYRMQIFMEDNSSIWTDRLIRKDIRYVNPIHTIPAVKTYKKIDIKIKHDRNTMNKEARDARNKQREEMIFKHLGDKGDPRSLFYLAQQHHDSGNWSAAMIVFAKYLRYKTFQEERSRAFKMINDCLEKLK